METNSNRSIYLNELLFSEKLLVKRSKIHRWGVFARLPIKKYEILEEFPYFKVLTDEMNNIKGFTEYSYSFDDKFSIIGMGFCGLYNHSFKPNVHFEIDRVNEVMRHYAITDIDVGDELTLDYGEENASYFNLE
jgi:SET domain-containing protein